MSGTGTELRFRAAALLGVGLVRTLFATARVSRRGQEHYMRLRREGRPVIFVFWHGQLLPLLYQHRGEGIVVLVSDHADGEYVARIIERLGFGTARGSSTRGAARGLRGLIRAAREGRDLALTPDGPRGPARKFKPGALLAARITGLPIIPVAVGSKSAWRMPSWDRFLVPRPFAAVELLYGAPYRVPARASDEDLARHAGELEGILNEMGAALVAGDEERPAASEVPA